MKKTLIASLIGLALTPPAYSAENIELDDVVVTATRTAQPRESVVADVTVIGREEIERAGQSTFVELLQRQPGVEIASNGGAGTNSSLFLRGTNSKQVVVLVDGLRVGSATLGQTAFQNIPLAQIERIEILRGPASSLYGQDAVGGVVQIFTKKGSGTPSFYGAVGYGTYNTKTAEAGVSGSINDTSFALNISSKDTDSFSTLRIKSDARNDNDRYRNLAANASITHQITEGHSIGLQVLSSEGRIHYDSEFGTFNNYSDMSQLSYGISFKNQFTSNWHSTFRIGEGIDNNKNQLSETSQVNYKTKQKQLSWQNDINLPIGTLTLLYDRLEQKIHTDFPFAEDERDTNGYMIGYLANIDKHSIHTTIRNDQNSLFGTHTTGGLGYGYQINHSWRITGSYATAFRAPTFNDQYYVSAFGAFNNPNIKPEESENLETSLRYENEKSDVSITIYKNRIHDFITLDSGFLATNVNAEIKGVTFAASQSWGTWLLQGSLDIQSPKNKDDDTLLARRANRHASLNLSREWGDWRIGSELFASSRRYNRSENDFKLSGYSVVNLIVDYKVNRDWSVQGRLNNLFDKNYALAYSKSASTFYNTPGSNLFVSIRYAP